jgi:hypothetical protein
MAATMRKPRLLILSFSPIVSDARVLKQVRHFAANYDVTTCGYGDHPGGAAQHVRIPDDQPYNEHPRRLLVLRLHKLTYWKTAAVAFAAKVLRPLERFDIIIANDIDTVGLALSLRPLLGVHADIHEYAPKQNEELPMWRWFIAPYVRWMCRTYLTKATSVTTVGQGVANEYKRVFGISAGIATNSAPYLQLEPTAVSAPIRIVHSGAVLRNRSLDVTVRAVTRTTTPVTLDLFLMPNDPGHLDELKVLAARSDRVTIHNPLPYSELLATLNDYDLGIHVIPPTNFNNAWSLPNKFFDYVQARLGLVIGPSPEMKDILERHDLGVAATGFDEDSIVAVLDGLIPEVVATWKRKAHAAAHELSAESQIEVWDEAITAIAQRPPGSKLSNVV